MVNNSPIISLPQITEAPGIMNLRNPTAKRTLKTTPRVHHRHTRNNTPGIVAPTVSPPPYVPIPSGAQRCMVTRHAINSLTETEQASCQRAFTPSRLLPPVVLDAPSHREHFCSPMVHPITGETISSYKKLMHDLATAETWQTAFGKDFGGMMQGDDKTGQKGTNAVLVMSRKEIRRAHELKKKFTYGNPVADYRPQKDDPHRIRITAGGNLITYDLSPSVRTADLDTAKLHWNKVISTPGAQYMCLDIKNFYLTAKLDYYEYMRMPLDLFPVWIKKQYNLDKLAYEGYVHLEMRRAVWGLPQAGILANMKLRQKLARLVILNPTLRGFGNMSHGLFRSRWWSMILGLNMWTRTTLIISYHASKNRTNSPRTGRATCIAGLNSSGIMLDERSTYQCRDILRKKCRNTIISNQKRYKTVHTHRPQFGSEAQQPLPQDSSP